MTTKSTKEQVAEWCIPVNLEKSKRVESSTGKYSLLIEVFSSKDADGVKQGWNVSKGTVLEGDNVIHEIYRNYASFWYEWLENHPSGKAYLLYGENYQGYSLYNLEDRKEFVYLPTKAQKGSGWCFAETVANPSQTVLAVHGCYWACPYEYRFYDLTDIETLPWKIVREDRTGYAHCANKEHWVSDTKLQYRVEDFFVPFFNKKEHEMTDEDWAKMEAMEYKVEKKFPDIAEEVDYFWQYSNHTVDINDPEFREIRATEKHPRYKEVDTFVKSL